MASTSISSPGHSVLKLFSSHSPYMVCSCSGHFLSLFYIIHTVSECARRRPKAIINYLTLLVMTPHATGRGRGVTQWCATQQTQNICIAFMQRRTSIFDVGPTL